MPIRPAPALIVFDIDGTLLETQRVTVPAVQRVFSAEGLPVPEAAVICRFFGRPIEEHFEWLRAQCPAERYAEVAAAIERLELELIGSEGCLYPGARDVLGSLKDAGYSLAICSNGPDDYVDEVLDAHDLRGFFRLVRCRGTRYSGKAEMLGEILGRIAARPAIVVGDRDDDMSAAHAHGAFAIGAAYGFAAAGELDGADAVVSALIEVPEFVARLASRR